MYDDETRLYGNLSPSPAGRSDISLTQTRETVEEADASDETTMFGVPAAPVAPAPVAAAEADAGDETTMFGVPAAPVAPAPVAAAEADASDETTMFGVSAAPVAPAPVAAAEADAGDETTMFGVSAAPVAPAPVAAAEADASDETCLPTEPIAPPAKPQPLPPSPAPAAAAVPAAESDNSALPCGAVLNSIYVIEKFLGKGGFGVTYLAKDTSLGRSVVIKENFPSAFAYRAPDGRTLCVKQPEKYKPVFDMLQRGFINEAKTIAQIGEKYNHPNIVDIKTYFEENNTAYYVMRYVDGKPLKSYIGNRNLSEKELENLLLKLLEGLHYLHSKKIVHLDIKPDNILMEEGDNPVLIDFGASRLGTELSDDSYLVGSPGYAPIEQQKQELAKNIGPRSDIYALGATLYHLLTGKKPKGAVRPLQLRAQEFPGIYKAFLAGVDRAMQADPAARWQSAAEWKTLIVEMRNMEEKARALHEGRDI